MRTFTSAGPGFGTLVRFQGSDCLTAKPSAFGNVEDLSRFYLITWIEDRMVFLSSHVGHAFSLFLQEWPQSPQMSQFSTPQPNTHFTSASDGFLSSLALSSHSEKVFSMWQKLHLPPGGGSITVFLLVSTCLSVWCIKSVFLVKIQEVRWLSGSTLTLQIWVLRCFMSCQPPWGC
jgi:hypothetical protein